MNPRRVRDSVFRPHRVLAVAMAGAAVFWGYALYFLLGFDGVPWKTLVTAASFTAFFLAGVLYYGRTAIYVDDGGLTYRGMVRTIRIEFDQIRALQVLPGPLTVYSIRGAGRFVHFTSFFRRHRALARIITERTGGMAGFA
ncbi:MAG: PH domain-containing protein [Myxococcaceae bacterium]